MEVARDLSGFNGQASDAFVRLRGAPAAVYIEVQACKVAGAILDDAGTFVLVDAARAEDDVRSFDEVSDGPAARVAEVDGWAVGLQLMRDEAAVAASIAGKRRRKGSLKDLTGGVVSTGGAVRPLIDPEGNGR